MDGSLNLHLSQGSPVAVRLPLNPTEAAPVSKYQTRFRSRTSLSAPESELAHDHVYQRKRLIDEMIVHPKEVNVSYKALLRVS
jgi:hypothetical protein